MSDLVNKEAGQFVCHNQSTDKKSDDLESFSSKMSVSDTVYPDIFHTVLISKITVMIHRKVQFITIMLVLHITVQKRKNRRC